MCENNILFYTFSLLNIFGFMKFFIGPPLLGATYGPKHKRAIFSQDHTFTVGSLASECFSIIIDPKNQVLCFLNFV